MSIASRITSMEQHIGNAYDKLDELGVDLTNVDKNLNNIAELLDGVYEEYPKIEENDVTEPSINNTKAGKMEIDLKGNTEQTTYTGKNLFNKDNYEWSSNTVIKYNSIYVGDGTFTLSSPNMPTFNEGKNMFLLAGDVSTGASSGTNGVDKNTPRTVISVDGYVTIGNRYILSQDTGLYHPQDYDWMLEKGSSATSYEPYTGGTASPNPDFPQDVEVVSGENTVKVTNKNLFDKNNTTNNYWLLTDGTIEAHTGFVTSDFIKIKSNTNYYITNTRTRRLKYYDINKNALTSDWDLSTAGAQSFTTLNNASYVRFCVDTDLVSVDTVQLEQGSTATTYEEHKEQDFHISLSSRNLFDKNNVTNNIRLDSSGNPYNDGPYCTSDYFEIKSNTVYSFNPLTESCALCVYDKNKNFVYRWLSGDITTATTPNEVYYARLAVQKTRADEFQIEEGSTATDYQSFYNYELCKIGDYQDYIYKNNDKWYMKKKISKTILNGTELWIFSTTKTITQVFLCNNGVPYFPKKTNLFYSNYFIYQDGDAPKIALIDTNHDVYVAINKTLASNVDSFKAWLSTHNTSLYYILKNEQDIQITDTTLINQLNNLYNAKSYDNTTNIIQENNNLPFILDIKTLKKS